MDSPLAKTNASVHSDGVRTKKTQHLRSRGTRCCPEVIRYENKAATVFEIKMRQSTTKSRLEKIKGKKNKNKKNNIHSTPTYSEGESNVIRPGKNGSNK